MGELDESRKEKSVDSTGSMKDELDDDAKEKWDISTPSDTMHFSQNVGYGTTKRQLLLNDLTQWQNAHKYIHNRSINEKKTYREIEEQLNTKIKKYEDRYNRKLQHLLSDKKEAEDLDVESVIDEVVHLEVEISTMKKLIHKKKWFHDRNGLYRKLVEQDMLREKIDGLTQKIRYFEQMIMNAVNSMNNSQQYPNHLNNLNPFNNQYDVNANIVTPFVVREALRIRTENEKILNDLRAELDELRANRAQ